ncbi:helix-hairpin-helix domain-containing protein [Micromonospora chersina]|uniref:helix-hairpin-helix domain-containing protein n=1 Tax=Micromonospora chersina TaxID=47854 RepID=UPI0033F4E584
MPSSFGQWLVLILALLVGLGIGWVVSGRRNAAGSGTPTVEGAAVPAPEVTATVDQERPEAVVDEVPAPAAVTEQPAPVEQDAAPAAATLAAQATTLPSAEPVSAGSAAVEPAAVEPVAVEEPGRPEDEPARAIEPVEVAAEPVAVEPVAAEETEPVRTAPEPVVADAEPATSPAAETEPAPAAEPVSTPAEAVPSEPVAVPAEPVAEAEPVAVPAPRAAVEDAAPVQTDAPDDFRRIQGIGPKLAAALQAAGIRTYQQLAELDEAALRETVKAAGLRAAPGLATWSQQAKVLAGARADAERVLPVGVGEDA